MQTLATTAMDVSGSVLSTVSSNLSNNNGTIGTPSSETNIFVGIVIELVILVLVSGNLLMILTLFHYKPWSITDLLLFSLSLADFINGAIPAQTLNIVNSFYGQNCWSAELCAVFIWMTFSLRMISVFTITLISAERMLMLTRPLHHHSIITIGKARIAVFGIWLFAVFIAILPFIGAGNSGFVGGYCHYQLYDLGIAYGYVIEAIGVIQLALVLACFIAIRLSSGKFIKRQSVMAAANQTGGGDTQKKAQETSGIKQIKQLSKMMGIVVILYYISWLPYLLINFVGLVRGHLSHTVEVIVGFFSLVNAIINPILYGKMSLRYRRGYQFIFRKIMSICGGTKPDGRFFDGKRRGSQGNAYSIQSYKLKRGSVASTLRVEGQQVNAAFVEDEHNHNHIVKQSSQYKNDDDDDDDDDDNGISIYPVAGITQDEHNEVNNNHSDDDNDETQISICPLNESVQFCEENGTTSGVGYDNARMGEGNGRKTTSDASEEDISICPLGESILAHFEDIQKLVSEEDDSSSRSSGNNEDIIDLLEEDSKAARNSKGHFFVDDVVKLLEEDKEIKSQVNNRNSYDFLPKSQNIDVNEERDVDEENCFQGYVIENKAEKQMKKDEDKDNDEEENDEEEYEDEAEGKEGKTHSEDDDSNFKGEKDEEDDEKDDEYEDEDEEDQKSSIEEDSDIKGEEEEEEEEVEEEEVEVEDDNDDEEEDEDEEENEDEEEDKDKNEDNSEEEHTEADEEDDNDYPDAPRRKLSNFEMEGYSGLIKCFKTENSTKRKYTRSVSDLLRKELGEI